MKLFKFHLTVRNISLGHPPDQGCLKPLRAKVGYALVGKRLLDRRRRGALKVEAALFLNRATLV